jgi:hypothetical protein
MKTFFVMPMMILLPFFLAAQSLPTHKVVENIMKHIPMGMPLEDFKNARPNANPEGELGDRIEYLEKFDRDGIKEITYYFVGDTKNKPFYEVIIELDNADLRATVAKKFFGDFNHPKEENHWVIYKGSKDYLTVGWIYESKIIYAGNIPNSGYFNSDMFKLLADFKDIDKRISKNGNVQPVENEEVKPEEAKVEETAEGESEEVLPNTVNGYSKELATIFQSNFKLKMTSDSLQYLFSEVKSVKNTPDFRNEFTVPVNKNGFKEVTFYGIKNGTKGVYEVIFEFENADTLMRLAEMMFSNVNHPSLENHWVLNIAPKMDNGLYLVSLAWVYENRMILAINLPDSEWEKEENFQFTDAFVDAYLKQEGLSPVNNKPVEESTDNTENEATSLAVNNLIAAALKDFEDNKTDLMPNKKEEYNAASLVTMGQDQAVIRKNAAGNWRLEVRFPVYESSDKAKEAFENTLTFYQKLEGLEYRLVKKSDLATANGRTYIWDIQTMDDQPTGVILKWQTYPASNGQFGIKMELGK